MVAFHESILHKLVNALIPRFPFQSMTHPANLNENMWESIANQTTSDIIKFLLARKNSHSNRNSPRLLSTTPPHKSITNSHSMTDDTALPWAPFVDNYHSFMKDTDNM